MIWIFFARVAETFHISTISTISTEAGIFLN